MNRIPYHQWSFWAIFWADHHSLEGGAWRHGLSGSLENCPKVRLGGGKNSGLSSGSSSSPSLSPSPSQGGSAATGLASKGGTIMKTTSGQFDTRRLIQLCLTPGHRTAIDFRPILLSWRDVQLKK